MNSICRVATHLEILANREKSGNLGMVREKSGKKEKLRESVFLHMVNLDPKCAKKELFTR